MKGRPSELTAEDVADLLDQGCSSWDIQRTLGMKVDSIVKACRRAEQWETAARLVELAFQDRMRAHECLTAAG